jgi:hypothetical protein
MTEPPDTHVNVEMICWRDDPITGTVCLGGEAAVPFVGWVGLITTVEHLREPLRGPPRAQERHEN